MAVIHQNSGFVSKRMPFAAYGLKYFLYGEWLKNVQKHLHNFYQGPENLKSRITIYFKNNLPQRIAQFYFEFLKTYLINNWPILKIMIFYFF